MLIRTKGIVFQSVKYGESSLIVKIFTEVLGLQSYIVKGVRRPKAKIKPSMFEPLTLLELVVYHKPGQNLQHIKEIRVDHAWRHIPFSVEKQTVLLFLNEILHKTIREEHPNEELFAWIYHSLVWFDAEETSFPDFHLYFLVRLSRFLGFYPKNTPLSVSQIRYFDMQEGSFTAHRPAHAYFSEGTAAQKLFLLLQASPGSLKDISFSAKERRLVLDSILSFYNLHLPAMGKIKSLDILRTIFSSQH